MIIYSILNNYLLASIIYNIYFYENNRNVNDAYNSQEKGLTSVLRSIDVVKFTATQNKCTFFDKYYIHKCLFYFSFSTNIYSSILITLSYKVHSVITYLCKNKTRFLNFNKNDSRPLPLKK